MLSYQVKHGDQNGGLAYADWLQDHSAESEYNGIRHREIHYEKNGKEETREALVAFAYMDEDDIPEMLVFPLYYEPLIVSYKDGAVIETNKNSVRSFIAYQERNNLLRHYSQTPFIFTNMYGDTVFTGGAFVSGLRFEGYKCNEDTVDREESIEALRDFYDPTGEKMLVNESVYSYEDALRYLTD